MKIISRKKIHTLHVMPNDTISLHYKQVGTFPNGKEEILIDKEVLKSRIGREMVLNEAVIFDVEAGELGDNTKDGIGGAFLST